MLQKFDDVDKQQHPNFGTLDFYAESDDLIPTLGSEQSAGYDIKTKEDFLIVPGERKLIKSGVFLKLTPAFGAMVCSRSGLAFKKGIYVLNSPGIVDSDYRGEIGVILHNAGGEWVSFKRGDRIAQLVFFLRFKMFGRQVSLEQLNDTSRGDSGFGSTGL